MVGEDDPTIHGFSRDGEFTVEYRGASAYTLCQRTSFLPNSAGGVTGSIRAVTGEPSIKDCTISEERICR